MRKIKVDLDDLVSSFTYDSEGLSKEYLNVRNGEIVHITEAVERAVENESGVDELPDWEKELVADAEAVLMDEEDNYLLIEPIGSSYFYKAMLSFTEEEVTDEKVKEKLDSALNGSNPMRGFKNTLHDYQVELEAWYEYEDQKAREYVLGWLEENNLVIEK